MNMRIAQVSTLATPVLSSGSGSVESHVALLATGLTRLGHKVTVFASAGSTLPQCEVVATLPGTYGHNGSPDDWQLCEWINLARAIGSKGRFDLIHSHAYLWGMPLEHLTETPMLHTLHVMPHEDQARLWTLMGRADVAAISREQWAAYPHLKPAAVVHHGVDPEAYPLVERQGDYLCYLGRFLPGKGAVAAIDAAQAAKMPLRLAGPADAHFDRDVSPRLNGEAVAFSGWLVGAAKASFLGQAAALLYPVQKPEPFGLVMIEAMMCGTPVVALRAGAVPEIVDDGVTGCIADTPEELPQKIRDAMRLDRVNIRETAVRRFSASRMASEYSELYEQLIRERRTRS